MYYILSKGDFQERERERGEKRERGRGRERKREREREREKERERGRISLRQNLPGQCRVFLLVSKYISILLFSFF